MKICLIIFKISSHLLHCFLIGLKLKETESLFKLIIHSLIICSWMLHIMFAYLTAEPYKCKTDAKGGR